MAVIKSLDVVASRWASITPMHSGDYAEGIANPRRSWSTSTQAAEGSYEAGVQRAVQRHAFKKGVAAAGDEKWQRKAGTKGVRNWGPGVAEAEGDYKAGFAPYHAAIAACNLPPRYARQDPRNMARVKAICDCLIAKKLTVG